MIWIVLWNLWGCWTIGMVDGRDSVQQKKLALTPMTDVFYVMIIESNKLYLFKTFLRFIKLRLKRKREMNLGRLKTLHYVISINEKGANLFCHSPSFVINTSRCWIPTQEIKARGIMDRWTDDQMDRHTNGRIEGQTDGQTDGHAYYTVTQGIWTRDLQLHSLQVIMAHAHYHQKATRTNGQRDR